MKKIALGVAFLCVWGATTAGEFTLQFPVSAGNHKTLRVAGYAIDALGVTGPCDRSYTSGGSGRGGRYITHRYYGQCKWDLSALSKRNSPNIQKETLEDGLQPCVFPKKLNDAATHHA